LADAVLDVRFGVSPRFDAGADGAVLGSTFGFFKAGTAIDEGSAIDKVLADVVLAFRFGALSLGASEDAAVLEPFFSFFKALDTLATCFIIAPERYTRSLDSRLIT